jgi:phosphatidate cytidylyltransferase
LRYSDDEGGGPRDRDEPIEDPFKEATGVTITGAHQAVSRPPDPDAPVEASLDDWSFVRGTSPDAELPHWTEAPTGQVPAVLARDDVEPASDDPWSAVPAPAWRQDETDWAAHEEGFEPSMLGDDGGTSPVAGDDARRPWELDETQVASNLDEEDLAMAVGATAAAGAVAAPATRVRARNSRSRRTNGDGPMTGRAARPASPSSRNMTVAIMTGLVLGIFALIIFNSTPFIAVILAVVVVTMGAGEAFGALRQSGHRPAAALGLVACFTLMIASYNKGITALPLVTALCFLFTFLWYLSGVERSDAIEGVGSTMLVYVWVGVLGSFAGLLLAPADFPSKNGLHFVLGALILTVANDVGALASGKVFGRHLMAPSVSPNKTWEGVIGGGVFTLICVPIVAFIAPWTAASAFTLALCTAVFAPLGDLCESMFKRSIGVKDMGRMLPGHGGILDRLDGLLFVLPATYYVVLAFKLS